MGVKRTYLGLLALGITAFLGVGSATTIATVTLAGPPSATAVFDLSGTTLTLTLTDTVVDPTDVADNLTAFFFTVTDATVVNLTSSSGLQRTVTSTTSFTDAGSPSSTGWLSTNSAGVEKLDDL